MLFQFDSAIQAGIDSGMYEVVRNTATKQLLGIVRSKETGHFVAQAIGVTTKAVGLTIEPLIAPVQFVMGGLQMV